MSDKTKCPTCGEDRNHTRLDACLFDYQNYLARTTAALEAENAELKAALENILREDANPDDKGSFYACMMFNECFRDALSAARALLKG